MKPLIFPYTDPFRNPFIDMLEEEGQRFSIISTSVKDAGMGIIDSMYENIAVPDKDILQSAYNFYKQYTDEFSFYRNVEEFLSFFEEDDENLSRIARDIKGVKSVFIDKKLIVAYFYLFLFSYYEKLKNDIDLSYVKIQAKEKNIFSMLDSSYDEIAYMKNSLNRMDDEEVSALPENFLKLRVKSWMEAFFDVGSENLLWVTDKKCYLETLDDLFIEKDVEFLSSEYDLSVFDGKSFRGYRSVFTLEESISKIFSKDVDKLVKPSIASKYICIILL